MENVWRDVKRNTNEQGEANETDRRVRLRDTSQPKETNCEYDASAKYVHALREDVMLAYREPAGSASSGHGKETCLPLVDDPIVSDDAPLVACWSDGSKWQIPGWDMQRFRMCVCTRGRAG